MGDDMPSKPSELLAKTQKIKEILFSIRSKLQVVLPQSPKVGKSAIENTSILSGVPMYQDLEEIIEIASALRDEINL